MAQHTARIRTSFAATVATTVAIAALATASFAPSDVHANGRRFRDRQEARQ
jgi:hypothetical protein